MKSVPPTNNIRTFMTAAEFEFKVHIALQHFYNTYKRKPTYMQVDVRTIFNLRRSGDDKFWNSETTMEGTNDKYYGIPINPVYKSIDVAILMAPGIKVEL